MRLCSFLTAAVLSASVMYAQSVISARSGVVHYMEGRVLANDKLLAPANGEFPQLNAGEELRTEDGRAEVLLTPGAFLRIGENSSVKLLSNSLSDTRLELLSGTALVECDELLKDNAITIVENGVTVDILKHGLYRFDSSPARLRVYDGEALVKSGSGQLTLKKGHESMLGAALMAVKFDTKDTDELFRWSSRRAGYLSVANVSAARSLSNMGWISSGWQFNPWYGMYTFVPFRGTVYSPFGFAFWSPATILYYPIYASGYYPSGGSSRSTPAIRRSGDGVGYTSVGRADSGVSAASSSSAHSSTAAAPVGSSTGGGHGRH